MNTEKIRYFLETFDTINRISVLCWEINFINTKRPYTSKEITIEVKKNLNENTYNRHVLIEKKQINKKRKLLSELHFFEQWSIISVFDSTHILKGVQRENDFKLLKMNIDGEVIEKGILEKCTLRNSSLWGNNQLEQYTENDIIGIFQLNINSFYPLSS